MMAAASPATDQPVVPTLNIPLQTRYWLRCLKTLLPTGYQSQDSSRIVLGFFTLTSLDLLGVLEQHLTPELRESFVTFIYHCQHPGGGFRSFPGTDFGDQGSTKENARWDPANVAGTYFALAALVILGDDLSRVERKKTLAWVRNLQRADGSFGDIASGKDGVVDGGQDVRFCFLASLVCVLLEDGRDSRESIEKNINGEALTRFILASQTYDGGIARKPNCESHAGSTYCGLSTLQLLDQLPPASKQSSTKNANHEDQVSPEFVENMLHWLSYRQTTMLHDYRDVLAFDEDDEDHPDEQISQNGDIGFTVLNATPALQPHILDFETPALAKDGTSAAGMNGRVNKPADTCYSFWAGAALSILGHPKLIDHTANRRYLLSKTQHKIGGFGKFPGDLPDILHSALALAYLAIHDEPGLKSIDPILCVSSDVKTRIENLPWKRTN